MIQGTTLINEDLGNGGAATFSYYGPQSQLMMAASYGQIPEAIENEEDDDGTGVMGTARQQEAEDSVVHHQESNQMTESEFDDDPSSNHNQPDEAKVFLLPKQVKNEQRSTSHEEHQQIRAGVQKDYLQMKHLEQRRQGATLKNSLLSSAV